MRKLLLFLTALLVAFPAYAGWNIKQNDDGTAEWVNSRGDTSAVGVVYITTILEDVSTASTTFLVSPITAARIVDVRSVLAGAITGANSNIDIAINTDGTFDYVTPITFAVAWSGSATGDGDGTAITSGNALAQGTGIAIHTDGGSTWTQKLYITVTIEPAR